MNVLGFDTATGATAVALRLNDGSASELRDDPRPEAHPGHATRLLGLAHELLDRHRLDWAELQRIAVGTGPGTFTGLRVGIATAHGLAQSLDLELVAVSSLRALAHAAEQAGTPAPLLPVIDARRKEVFAALYGPEGEQLIEPRPLPPEQLAELVESAPGAVAFGDGALRYREVIEQAGLRVGPEHSPLHAVRAIAICELGAAADLQDAPVLPDYRRRPDAELAQAPGGARTAGMPLASSPGARA